MFQRVLAGWSGLVLCMLAGCTSLPAKTEPLRVSLSGLSIVDVTLYEQRYMLSLRVQNPNPHAIKIKGMDYEISLNGLRFAEGVDNQRIEVAAFGETTIEVAVVSNTRRIIEQLTQLDRQREFRYALSGSVYLEGFGAPLPFRYSGTISFAPEPAIEPAKPIQTRTAPEQRGVIFHRKRQNHRGQHGTNKGKHTHYSRFSGARDPLQGHHAPGQGPGYFAFDHTSSR